MPTKASNELSPVPWGHSKKGSPEGLTLTLTLKTCLFHSVQYNIT